MTRARTIAAAVDNFAAYALDPAADNWGEYVTERTTYLGTDAYGRQGDIRPLVRRLRREAQRPRAERAGPKLLVSGHKGTGKSTELNRIARDLSSEYEVVKFGITHYLNENDVDARDVLYVLAGAVVQRIHDLQGLTSLDRDDEARAALDMLKSEVPERRLRDAEIGFNFFGVSARMRLDTELRGELRRVASLRPDDLRTVVNRCFAALEALAERPVLVIIDDLDKVLAGAAGRERLFSVDFPLLLAPQASIVYTIPIDIHYDDKYVTLHSSPDRVVLGHIKLWNDRSATSRCTAGWDVMREFVARRMSPELLDDGVLDRAIELSGGSFDQLRLLLSWSLDYADFRGAARIDAAALGNAKHRLMSDLVRVFGSADHLGALARIHAEKSLQLPDDLVYLPLAVVQEHVNDTPWFDVNPVFREYLLDPNRTGARA